MNTSTLFDDSLYGDSHARILALKWDVMTYIKFRLGELTTYFGNVRDLRV